MNNKKKLIILSSIIVGVLVVIFGLSYALFSYVNEGETEELVLGDIWMKYRENNGIEIEDMLPGDEYSKYFEFTISGKNTYTEKDIYYEILLTRGDVPEGKIEDNRISDNKLLFKLTEVGSDDSETTLLEDVSYDELVNQRIYIATINKEQNEEINTKYRLYMTVSGDIKICGGDLTEECDYYTSGDTKNWSDAFASVKVNVYGDLEEKSIGPYFGEIFKEYVLTNQADKYVEEDGIIYLSGKNPIMVDLNKPSIDFNNVWYSGKLWRITAIYPDGTMKLITTDPITSLSFGNNGNFYTDENNNSYVYQWLNQEFLPTLYNYENIIVEDSEWNATKVDDISAMLPETKEDGAVLVNSPVGLLNSYEFYKSKELSPAWNYLGGIAYSEYWWLMSGTAVQGADIKNLDSKFALGIHPVINLQSDVEITGGTGTATAPYLLKGDIKPVEVSQTLLNTRINGEYVNFDGELYRIVNVNDNETIKLSKLLAIGTTGKFNLQNSYFDINGNNSLLKYFASTKKYGDSNNEQTDDYWDYYLNNTWKSAINDEYENMMVEDTYFLGEISEGTSYKASICKTIVNNTNISNCEKTNNTWKGYVGLPRYGELFSENAGGFSLFVFDGVPNSSYVASFLLTTAPDKENVYVSQYTGYTGLDYLTAKNTARPSITLNSQVKITGGTGTLLDPFEISL